MSNFLDIAKAKAKLIEGNQRFINNKTLNHIFVPYLDKDKFFTQAPFAVILGCSDSRAPVEMIFDQSQGDLFVIRIAGNLVTPSQLGSIELAIAKFGAPLVVVLSHEHCGAVAATVDECLNQTQLSKNINYIANCIKPSVEPLLNKGLSVEQIITQAIQENAKNSVLEIHKSEIVAQAVALGQVAIIGAHYSLETGLVSFKEAF